MAKTTVPGLYIADGAITAAKLSSTLDLSGVTITVATASTGDSDTSVASTAFVQQEIAALVDSSPSALNTLNELAAAIGDDASFSTTVTNSIATKLPLAGGTLTGNLIINTTGSIQIPVGTTAQRPTAAQGQLRFNTTTSKPEIYSGSAWTDVGGGVESVNSATGVVVLTTANITENTNLYYTDARADARIAAADTDDLSEGSTNLYFTTARANSAFDGRLSGSTGVTVSNGAVSIGQDVATSTSPTFQNLTLSGTNSIKVPSGTTAQRSGSPANGMLRYNSSTNEFEGYADSAWGAIGGDTTSSVDLYTATGNGSTATYDTGKNPQSENNTWVFVGGVYQPKSTYSFSGTQITLSENLPNGEDLEVITGTVSTYNPTDAILGQYNVTTSNTASYDTSLTTENENNVFVFVDGVYQPKSSYTYSGSTLTLDAVPTSGMSLEVLVTRSMNAATVTTGFLADDAVTTVKILDANVTAGKLASSLDLTGKTVTVATASTGDNDTSVASTAFVRQEITALVDSAPAAMDTLNELAAALGDDANFSTTVNASIAAKLPLAGGTLTGDINFGDSDKAVFGAGSDLQIYHDASGGHSRIDDTGTGGLVIRGSQILLEKYGGGYMINAVQDGAVTIHYSGSEKLATTSTGIDVTGVITQQTPANTDSVLTVDSTSTNVSQRLNLSANGTIQTQLYDDASQTKLIAVTNKPLILSTNNTERLRIDSSGAVGIGQVPETARWSGHDILQVGGRATFLGNDTVSSTGQTVLLDNLYYDASGNFQHRGDARGVAMQFVEGKVIFSNSNQTTGTPTVTTRMTIDNDGNVGIGTTSPSNGLQIKGDGDSLKVSSADYDIGFLGALGSGGTALDKGYFYLKNAGTTKIQLHSDGNSYFNGGNVSIGTTNNTHLLHIHTDTDNAYAVRIEGSTNNASGVWTGLGIGGEEANTKSALLFEDIGLSYARGNLHLCVNGETNQNSATPSDAKLTVRYDGNVGIGTTTPNVKLEVVIPSTNQSRFAYNSTNYVEVNYDGFNVVGGSMVFETAGSEKMRVDTTGSLLVGTTSSYADSYHTIARNVNDDSGDAVLNVVNLDTTAAVYNTVLAVTANDPVFTGVKAISFRKAGGEVAAIQMSNAAVTYNTSSDYRLKENIQPIQNGLKRLNQLNPVKFDWKEDGTSSEGFIAHEVQEIFSDAISGEKDGEDMQGMDYGRITPLLVKAIQEQQEQIETLQREVQKLKG